MTTHRGLGDRLRVGDAYDGRGLSDHDATRIRARLREAARQPSHGIGWQPVTAVALTVVVAFGIWMATPEPVPSTVPPPALAVPLPARHPAPPLPTPAPTSVVAPAVAPTTMVAADIPAPERPAQRRDLRLTAPGGTRIVWTLDPDFEPVRRGAPEESPVNRNEHHGGNAR